MRVVTMTNLTAFRDLFGIEARLKHVIPKRLSSHFRWKILQLFRGSFSQDTFVVGIALRVAAKRIVSTTIQSTFQ